MSELKYPVEAFVDTDFESEDFNELLDQKKLTPQIHMPQLTQLDASKISFDTASLANKSIVITNRQKPKKIEQQQPAKVSIPSYFLLDSFPTSFFCCCEQWNFVCC